MRDSAKMAMLHCDELNRTFNQIGQYDGNVCASLATLMHGTRHKISIDLVIESPIKTIFAIKIMSKINGYINLILEWIQ